MGVGQETAQDNFQEGYSVPQLSKEIGYGVTLVLASFIIIGAILAIIDLNLFWVAYAVWVLLIAFLPAAKQRNLHSMIAWWLLALIVLPLVVEVVGAVVGLFPLEITFPFS